MTPFEQPASSDTPNPKKEEISEKKSSTEKKYSPKKEWETVNDDLKLLKKMEKEMNPTLPAKGLTYKVNGHTERLGRLPNGEIITLRKAAIYPVLELIQENGETWLKIGKPREGTAEFSSQYALVPVDGGLSQEVEDKDDLMRLLVQYDRLETQIKQAKRRVGNLGNIIVTLREISRLHVSNMTGREEMTDEDQKNYERVLDCIDIGPINMHRTSLGNIATMNTEDFDAFLAEIQTAKEKVQKKLEAGR